MTLYTFGDSILDCGHYNEFGVTPGRLLVHNDGQLFPEFTGQDLSSIAPVRLEHRAVDGALVNLHAHFLTGDQSWYVHTIEPSLRGASEIRRCFLPVLIEWLMRNSV